MQEIKSKLFVALDYVSFEFRELPPVGYLKELIRDTSVKPKYTQPKKKTSKISYSANGKYDQHHELFERWKSMLRRCYEKSHKSFYRYGGRGVEVCERWQVFDNFVDDLYPTYEKGLTLEREDNDGDYNPHNCSWVTRKCQQQNKVNNRNITHGGIERSMTEWAEFVGLQPDTVRKRLNRGWSVEEALTTKVD